jgi:hypothetical protein
VDLAARKQIGQTAQADAQHARGALAIIEEQLTFHRPLLSGEMACADEE